MFRRRPPYCAEAQAALEAERPVLRGAVLLIAAGAHAWQQVAYWRSLNPTPPAVCIPPGEAVQRFDWSLVCGREVWLYPGEEYEEAGCEALARCLLFAGAQRIEAVRPGREVTVFNPNRKVA